MLAKLRDDLELVGHPLERCIRRDQIDWLGRPPRGDVAEFVHGAGRRVVTFGAFDHLRRRVDAEEVCLRPARPQYPAEIARSATEVDDRAWVDGHAGDQVDEWPAALVGVPEVRGRVPLWHAFLTFSRYQDT